MCSARWYFCRDSKSSIVMDGGAGARFSISCADIFRLPSRPAYNYEPRHGPITPNDHAAPDGHVAPNDPTSAKMKTGYIVFAHGSSVETANDAVRAVTAELARRGGYDAIETAFLEGGRPGLDGAVEQLVGRGLSRI